MPSDDIRARIAEYEAKAEAKAEAERLHMAEAARRARPAAAPSVDNAPDDPWERLFSTPWLDAESLAQTDSDFSFNSWLAEGVRGLRGSLRGAGLNDEFWGHIRGAERELLLAARVLIDNRLALVEARNKAVPTENHLQEIDIEF